MKKIVAKYGARCPVCEKQVKPGSDSIAFEVGKPVAHWNCWEDLQQEPTNKYGASDEAFERRVSEWKAAKTRYAAAIAAKSEPATAPAQLKS